MNVVLPTSIEELEEAFVACHGLWRRSPGEGKWPFAGDGPWHLMQGEAGDFAGDGVDGASSSSAPRTPLDAAEVGERDRVTGWLAMIGNVQLRRVVHIATSRLHAGEARVPWKALAGWVGWDKTPAALARAYRRELALLLCKLHGWPTRRARQLVAGDGLIEAPSAVPVAGWAGEQREIG